MKGPGPRGSRAHVCMCLFARLCAYMSDFQPLPPCTPVGTACTHEYTVPSAVCRLPPTPGWGVRPMAQCPQGPSHHFCPPSCAPGHTTDLFPQPWASWGLQRLVDRCVASLSGMGQVVAGESGCLRLFKGVACDCLLWSSSQLWSRHLPGGGGSSAGSAMGSPGHGPSTQQGYIPLTSGQQVRQLCPPAVPGPCPL